MTQIPVSSIQLLNRAVYEYSTTDTFVNVLIIFKKMTQITEKEIELLNTNNKCNLLNTNSHKENNKRVYAYTIALLDRYVDLIMSEIKNNSNKYMKQCDTVGQEFTMNVSLLSQPVIYRFIINDQFKSVSGNPTARELFKTKIGREPNLIDWELKYTMYDEINIEVEFDLYNIEEEVLTCEDHRLRQRFYYNKKKT